MDMTLDDLIKINKKPAGPRGGGRGLGRAAGPGPARRLPNRSAYRAGPYAHPKAAVDSSWGYSAFPDGGDRSSNIETGTKLYISNLDYGVSNEDLKELFVDVGNVKRYGIHYDRSGRSKGTAEIVFSRRQDAVIAVKKYNNVQLDGKPMKIELVGTTMSTPAAGRPAGAPVDSNVAPRSGQMRGAFGRLRGRGRGFGSGRGQGRDRDVKLSAEDLDADLEKYHADAMQTN